MKAASSSAPLPSVRRGAVTRSGSWRRPPMRRRKATGCGPCASTSRSRSRCRSTSRSSSSGSHASVVSHRSSHLRRTAYFLYPVHTNSYLKKTRISKVIILIDRDTRSDSTPTLASRTLRKPSDLDSLTPSWANLEEEAAQGTHTHTIYAVRRVYSAAQWLRPSPVAHRGWLRCHSPRSRNHPPHPTPPPPNPLPLSRACRSRS